MKKIFNIKRFMQEIEDYAYWLFDDEGIILQIPDEDYLHDILLINCKFENYILDNDKLYEEFCAKVKEINIEELNKMIKFLLGDERMDWIDTINRIESKLLYNEELPHFYLIKLNNMELGIVEDEEYEIIKYLDEKDLNTLNDINMYMYRCENYQEVVEYAKEVHNFKWWKKIIIDIGG